MDVCLDEEECNIYHFEMKKMKREGTSCKMKVILDFIPLFNNPHVAFPRVIIYVMIKKFIKKSYLTLSAT